MVSRSDKQTHTHKTYSKIRYSGCARVIARYDIIHIMISIYSNQIAPNPISFRK